MSWIGISSKALSRLDEIEEAINYGFSGLELMSEGDQSIEIVFDKLKEIKSSFGIEITVHAPYRGVNPASPSEQKTCLRTWRKVAELSSEISDYLVLHPGRVANPNFREDHLRVSLDTFSSIREELEDLGIKGLVENLPKSKRNLGWSPSEIKEFLSLGFDLALDLGHANTHRLEEFLSLKPLEIHLHDNNGKEDEHLPLGKGTLELGILRKFKRVPWIIESRNLREGMESFDVLIELGLID